MDPKELKKIKKKIVLLFPVVLIVLGLMLFVPAGTFDYWEAWVYCAALLIPFLIVVTYLLRNDPELLARRLRLNEKESSQKKIIGVSHFIFFVIFFIPGLDHRFGWSDVPAGVVLAANTIVILGYLYIFLVFRENTYASRIVQVEQNQKVISTGPYALVRHPMYLGISIMLLATPIALGSYWAFPAFMIFPLILVYRIINEEEVLMRELPGYRDYMQNVRYRLVPGIW
ncbi:MAG: isoprenylcysteine carboxylmethyltransferase family protein [Methanoregula sp.]|nr:isoprenylcysteine carboxylmethyltransferase family protein [Methanoregula sp.]